MESVELLRAYILTSTGDSASPDSCELGHHTSPTDIGACVIGEGLVPTSHEAGMYARLEVRLSSLRWDDEFGWIDLESEGCVLVRE